MIGKKPRARPARTKRLYLFENDTAQGTIISHDVEDFTEVG